MSCASRVYMLENLKAIHNSAFYNAEVIAATGRRATMERLPISRVTTWTQGLRSGTSSDKVFSRWPQRNAVYLQPHEEQESEKRTSLQKLKPPNNIVPAIFMS